MAPLALICRSPYSTTEGPAHDARHVPDAHLVELAAELNGKPQEASLVVAADHQDVSERQLVRPRRGRLR